MKKLFLCLMLLSASATSTIAQNSTLLATLSHNDTIITVFSGANALVEAHNAAVDGDVINLSSGNFTASNIFKSITLRGIGMEMDTVNNIQPTTIVGNFYIHGHVSDIYIEGIYHDGVLWLGASGINTYLNNLKFSKCRFHEIRDHSHPVINATFTHCKITYDFTLQPTLSYSIAFINSYLANADLGGSTISNMLFINCIYEHNFSSGNFSELGSSIFQNSIIIGKGRGKLPKATDAYNCVAISDNTVFDNVTSNTTNIVVDDYSNLFKTYRGTYSDTETFELTDSAKAVFLGDDGTQVGIHGGLFPFEAVPDHPRITKFEVGNKSTSDGKLNVNITVEATGKSSGQ